MNRSKQYRLRLTDEEFNKLSEVAGEEGLTKSNLIRAALESYYMELELNKSKRRYEMGKSFVEGFKAGLTEVKEW